MSVGLTINWGGGQLQEEFGEAMSNWLAFRTCEGEVNLMPMAMA
jgi:hypothetical protein